MRFVFVAITGLEREHRAKTSVRPRDVAFVRESPENPYHSVLVLFAGIVFTVDEPFDELDARLADAELDEDFPE